MSNPFSLSRATCILSILGISLILLARYLDFEELPFYNPAIIVIGLALLFYDENDKLEHETRYKKCIETVKVLRPRGLSVFFIFIGMPFLLIVRILDEDHLLSEIIQPSYLFAIGIIVMLLLAPGIFARFRYNRRIERGEIQPGQESLHSPPQGLGVLFDPRMSDFEYDVKTSRKSTDDTLDDS